MSILIKGMEMPTEDEEIIIRIDSSGTVMTEYALPISGTKAVPVLPHGRLIDAEALLESIKEAKKKQPEISDVYDEDYFAVVEWVAYAPTIIPAEPPKEET